MILFYIDESGTGLKDQQSPYFVLACIAFPADDWHSVDSQVTTLKRQMISWANPEDFEIKGRDMRRGEKLFKGQKWSDRVKAMHSVAQLISNLPCDVFAVQVDKRDLPQDIGSDDLYRLSMSCLLNEIEGYLAKVDQAGMLMFDMRSDLHSSVQDRRVVDAYRNWSSLRIGNNRLIELPWFGFSAFYAGLQLADFSAYMIDYAWNERMRGQENPDMQKTYQIFQHKVRLLQIP